MVGFAQARGARGLRGSSLFLTPYRVLLRAVLEPQAVNFTADPHPFGAITFNVAFGPLDGPDNIGLFHITGVNAQGLCLASNCVDVHRFFLSLTDRGGRLLVFAGVDRLCPVDGRVGT